MSETTAPHTTTPPASADYAAVSRRLEEAVSEARKRRTIMTVVLTVITLLLAGYLLFAYLQIRQVDAPTVVQLAENQVDPVLNQPATQWASRLQEQAPTVIDQAAEAALLAPEQFADRAVAYVESQADEQLPQLQEQFDEMLSELFAHLEEQIEGFGDADSMTDEQARQLMTEVSNQFAESLDGEIDKLYQDYTAVSAHLIDQLDKLAEGQGLDEAEELHRRIIVSFLALLQRAQNEGNVAG